MTTDGSRIHGRDQTDAKTCALCRRRWRPTDFESSDPHGNSEYRIIPGPHPLAGQGIVGGGDADREGEAVIITVCPVCMDIFWPNTGLGYRTDTCSACKRTANDNPDAFELDARLPTKSTDPFGDWLAICDDCLAAFRAGRAPDYAHDRYFNYTADHESYYLDTDQRQ